jgi:hypothetical protein
VAESVAVAARRLLLRHVLPNTLAPVIVQASPGMAFAILAEAGLSFLGVGIKPPTATWGGMLQKALQATHHAPTLAIFPGVAIFLTVLALNLVGDALRDALDPRLRGRAGRALTARAGRHRWIWIRWTERRRRPFRISSWSRSPARWPAATRASCSPASAPRCC